MQNKLRFVTLAIASVMFLSVAVVLLSTEGCTKMKKGDYIKNISFSPDGKKLIFDRKKDTKTYLIHVYDLETGDLVAYKPSNEKLVWHMPRYSFNGQRIVFTLNKPAEKPDDFKRVQLAVMDVDGRNFQTITNSEGFKIYPSFSHSGKKVIFARADQMRKEGKTPAAGYDVYEVDITTQKEKRLTHFRFFEMSPPYYFPDDKAFIFAAEAPFAFPGVPNDYGTLKRMSDELKAKYKWNKIYVMRGNEVSLKPYFEFSDYSARPRLSGDGARLIFLSHGDPKTRGGGWQFYLYSQDGKHRRLTSIGKDTQWAESIWSADVSYKGDLLAVVLKKDEVCKILIYRVEDGSSREIALPDRPSRIITDVP